MGIIGLGATVRVGKEEIIRLLVLVFKPRIMTASLFTVILWVHIQHTKEQAAAVGMSANNILMSQASSSLPANCDVIWTLNGRSEAEAFPLLTVKRSLQRPTKHIHSSLMQVESTAVISPAVAEEFGSYKCTTVSGACVRAAAAAAGESGRSPYK